MTVCETCGQHYTQCEISAKYGFGHKCPPKWEVKIEDYFDEDEGLFVYADNAEEAAEKGLEEYDEHCGEGPTDSAAVHVKGGSGEWQTFTVTTEYNVSYHAETKKGE